MHSTPSGTLRTATGLALATAAISGTSNFINKIAVSVLKDPIAYTTLKNGLVALALVGVVVALAKHREIRNLTRRQALLLLGVGIIGGAVPFALFFTGLSMIPAVNAALIHKTLFIWVALLAIPFLKERIGAWQWLAIGAIFMANLVVGGFKGFTFSLGELLVLAATVLWAMENVIAKVALRDVSSVTVATARMTVGAIALSAFLAATGRMPDLGTLSATQWGWTGLAALFLFGYVTTWYAALKRAPATYVATLLVPAVLVTNVLSAVFVTHAYGMTQVASAALFVLGTVGAVVAWKRAEKTVTAPEPTAAN